MIMAKGWFGFLFFILVFYGTSFVGANYYLGDIYFTVPDTFYSINESISIKGYVYQANYSDNGTLVSSSSTVGNASVNLTIRNSNGTQYSNYTFITDSNGSFYSRNNYYPLATSVLAPSTAGNYYLRAAYTDLNNTIWFSEFQVIVVNQTLDILRVSSNSAKYNPSDSITIEAEAVKQVGDRSLYVSNVSINGSLRNSAKTIISNFSCTTGVSGKCTASVSAPSTYGTYFLELDNFKAFTTFSVVPFSVNIYMKDEVGQSLKNVYAVGEQGRVEVSVQNASTSDTYTFSGYIKDSSENVVKTITSTSLNSNNSFENSFLFTVDALTFSYGSYSAYVTVVKTNDGNISASTSFEVKDWTLLVNKKNSASGFEYGYSVFPNKTINMEIYPTLRSNGSVIGGINSSFFTIYLKDELNNILSSVTPSWNSSCGDSGCYGFSITSPINVSEYVLEVSVSYSGVTQTKTQIINVVNSVISSQSTNIDGDLKELFGTNEYVYLSLSSYNSTSASINLSDAEIFVIEYMNGTIFSYTNVSNFSLVNLSNSIYEWSWNSTFQRIKLDVPKVGGLYNVYLFGNNRSVGAIAKFIVNPYSVCSVPKDTPGQVGSGYYYVWQFKTTDTIYFEMKLISANNPLGKASVLNMSGNGTTLGSACSVSTTQQVVNNATISVVEVRNLESGAVENINTTASSCQSDDSSGGYSCTVKPLSKWDGGPHIVKFSIVGVDGTTSVVYSRFEARAFYLYGWSQTWQNGPSSNITFNIQMYEAGRGWWGNQGSGGLSGAVTLKKIEYQGRDGEWIWPPVDSGYNVSNVNSSTITGSTGTMSIPVRNAVNGTWKTGYYRAVLQGTTSSGDTDYGYLWFGVKRWDVYGQPIECSSSICNYKSYFNSRDNITLYIKISEAGDYNYGYSGGQSIGGNVSISVKKIEDCRKWPCKELNSSQFISNSIVINSSSPWYWNANINNQSSYIIRINSTSGGWGTGYYSVVLDVNGTDTGSAWFNTIAFYVDARPTDVNGTNYKYSIKSMEPMYFNVTTTRDYKGYSTTYNSSDYINTTISDIVLRAWDESNYRSLEYNYPENLNISPLSVNGAAVVNVSYLNGSWPGGYYYGEIILRNSNNETSTGWLWFEVRPFRVSVSSNSYSIDDTSCVNASVSIYEPSWYTNTLLSGNYSVSSVYEDTWTGSSRSRTTYTNFTSSSFNSTGNITLCPNSGTWGSGNWGGYHYINIQIRDNSNNNTQNGWLSFRATPFQISFGSIVGGTNKLTNTAVTIPVSVTLGSGANASGNLTVVSQWRYDNYRSTNEEYVFSVGSCFSNVSSQCLVNGTQNVTVYPPSSGWKIGYNYLNTRWTKTTDSSFSIESGNGIYFDGREIYNGYFSNSDANGYWKYDFVNNENITIKLYVRDSNYNAIDVNITDVSYAYSGDSCWSEWCKSYSTATWSLTGGGVSTSSGSATINIKVPSANWSLGYYSIKATISGSGGTAIVTGGSVRVKDLVAPNVTISFPTINQTVNGATFSFNATTSESANCYLSLVSYNNFNSWYCSGWNSTNSTNSSSPAGFTESCNTTKYNYNGSTYYYEWVSKNYHSATSGANYTYWYISSSDMVTDSIVHGFIFNTTDKATGNNMTAQHYGLSVWCYDSDWNSGRAYSAVKINRTVG